MQEENIFSFRDDTLHYHHTVTHAPNPNEFPFRIHSHNMHEIYYFASGDAEMTIEGTTYTLKEGMLVITASGQVHHLTVKSKDMPYERIVLMFEIGELPEYLLSAVEYALAGNHIVMLTERQRVWFEEACFALENAAFNKKGIKDALKSLVVTIMTKLSSMIKDESMPNICSNDIIDQIIQYINLNLTSQLSLDLIAKEFYRDKSHLNRIFKQVMGYNIWEYIIQKRVFNARQQLYLTRNITSAFSKSGFKDYSVFYRNYVKYIGLSPSVDLKQLTEKKGE